MGGTRVAKRAVTRADNSVNPNDLFGHGGYNSDSDDDDGYQPSGCRSSLGMSPGEERARPDCADLPVIMNWIMTAGVLGGMFVLVHWLIFEPPGPFDQNGQRASQAMRPMVAPLLRQAVLWTVPAFVALLLVETTVRRMAPNSVIRPSLLIRRLADAVRWLLRHAGHYLGLVTDLARWLRDIFKDDLLNLLGAFWHLLTSGVSFFKGYLYYYIPANTKTPFHLGVAQTVLILSAAVGGVFLFYLAKLQ